MHHLKRRRDFVRLRKGRYCRRTGLVLQALARADSTDCDHNAPRFGFTVTKKIGNAVVRNRAKRRLREVVRHSAPDHAQDNFDYVVIGRQETGSRLFSDLVRDLDNAFKNVHQPHRRSNGRSHRKPKK